MTVKNGPAACSFGPPEQATSQSHLLDKLYPQTKSLSSLKSEVGELLWCLEFPLGKELAQSGWQLFERLLRRYVDLRPLPHSGPEPSQATILHRPE